MQLDQLYSYEASVRKTTREQLPINNNNKTFLSYNCILSYNLYS